MKCLSKCLYSNKPPLPTKIAGYAPVKYGELFSERGFPCGTNLFGKIDGGVVLHRWSNDCIIQKEEEFPKCIFSNLNAINPKVFAKHSGINKDLSLRLIVKRFQMLCHV